MKSQIQRAASLLGKMAKGKKKTLTDEERRKRGLRLAEARKKRWPDKDEHGKKQEDR